MSQELFFYRCPCFRVNVFTQQTNLDKKKIRLLSHLELSRIVVPVDLGFMNISSHCDTLYWLDERES